MNSISAPAYLNGEFTTVGECRISVLDRGFLFGDGVYEVVPVYAGRMFEWHAHFERLRNSLRQTGIASPHTSAQWESLLTTLIERAAGADLSLYLQVSRGVAPREHYLQQPVEPTVFAMVMPLSPVTPEVLEKGIGVITAEDIRWQRCDIKSTSLIANVLLRSQAVENDAHDVILLRDDRITESSAANVFVIRDGVLATPPKDHWILAGITRDVLITLAGRHRIEVRERIIAARELDDADEIWLSSSTREILPVTRVDGKRVGDGRPGLMWRQFRAYLKAFV